MERVALVARCAGARCAGLLRLCGSHADTDTTDDPLAAAVRGRADGVLLHTDCLGPCHAGAVAAIGWAHNDGRSFTWAGPPELACGLDRADAADSLAARFECGATPPPQPPATTTPIQEQT